MEEPLYWMQHGGHYRPVDFNHYWVPSPIIQKPMTAPYAYVPRVEPVNTESEEKENNISGKVPVGCRRRSRHPLVLLHPNAQMANNYDNDLQYNHEQLNKRNAVSTATGEVQLREWKAWGYYARPLLHVSNGALPSFEFVKNYPPERSISSSIDIYEIFSKFRQRGSCCWIPGLQHPCLPPRPPRWKDPVIFGPQLFPWELQLNPFLQHRISGSTPIYWDVAVEPARVLMGYDSRRSVPLNEADKAQPATYPFVTHMYINGVAEFPLDDFPWPIMIRNDHGITCADVFEAIFRNFQFHVSRDDVEGWTGFQKQQMKAGFTERRGGELGDQVRRYDIMGTRMFRGLEPHPNHEGWMMFLGVA